MSDETRTKEDGAQFNVSGRSVDLPGERKVMLGTDQDGKSDSLFVRFVSPEAGVTSIRLSPETMDALVKLYALHLRDLTRTGAAWTVHANPEGEIVCGQE